MNYASIINLIFAILGGVFGLYLFHYTFFALVSVFFKKRFPPREEKLRYGIIVSCKDEENVIGRLIQSIREADYPQEKLDIYVIAHNCSDHTAEVAASLGANVIVDNNAEEKTLGQAYRYAIPRIENLCKYAGCFFFNADNTVKKDYFQKMNDAFLYHKSKATISSYRNALNMEQGVLPACYGLYFGVHVALAAQGREVFGTNSRVSGCGFLVPTEKLQGGWDFLSLTEDIEYCAYAASHGEEIYFCRDALFYDEQPTNFRTMWYQRLRWAKGNHVVTRHYFFPLLKAVFAPKSKRRFSAFICLTFHSEIILFTFAMMLLQVSLLLFSPLFGVCLQEAFFHWDANLGFFGNMFASLDTGFVFSFAKGVVFYFLTAFLTAFLVYLVGRDHYKEFKKWPMVKGGLLFPFFILLQYPIDIRTLFAKSITWVKIPHGKDKD